MHPRYLSNAYVVADGEGGDALFVDSGAPQNVEPTLDGAGCTIVLDLALGDGSASYLTSDLSYDYVRINAEYRS